jgi:hypothetical protein
MKVRGPMKQTQQWSSIKYHVCNTTMCIHQANQSINHDSIQTAVMEENTS